MCVHTRLDLMGSPEHNDFLSRLTFDSLMIIGETRGVFIQELQVRATFYYALNDHFIVLESIVTLFAWNKCYAAFMFLNLQSRLLTV